MALNWRHGLLAFAAWLMLVASPAFAGEPPPPDPDLLKQARATAKAGEYKDALALFQKAIGKKAGDVAVMGEAMRCALVAEDYDAALRLAKRGLKLAKGIKEPTEAEATSIEDVRSLQKSAKRKKELRDKFIPQFAANLIKNITKHKGVINKRLVEPFEMPRPEFKGYESQRKKFEESYDLAFAGLKAYRLKKDVADGELEVIFYHNEENGVVVCRATETYRDGDYAEQRLETICGLIRKQMKTWTKRLRTRSKQKATRGFWESGKDRGAHLEKPWLIVRRIMFEDGTASRWAAKITVRQAVKEGEEKPFASEPYQVLFELRSSFFK